MVFPPELQGARAIVIAVHQEDGIGSCLCRMGGPPERLLGRVASSTGHDKGLSGGEADDPFNDLVVLRPVKGG